MRVLGIATTTACVLTPAGIPDGGWPRPDSATVADAGVRAERFLASLEFIEQR